jgi:hypothetical protein
MLSALVWVPRELDARLRRQLAALPPAPDSMPLVRRLDSVRVLQRALPRIIRTDSARDSSEVAAARHDSVRIAVTTLSATASSPSRPDSAAIDLMARITRARTAPLPDSYRALADASLIRNDAQVRALADSIELVDREREAHAALGGPGARYAALTSRLTSLGQQLVRIAEQRVARAVLTSIGASSAARDSLSPARPDTSTDSISLARRDSVREALARGVAEQESLLAVVRTASAEHDGRRAALERRLHIDMPVVAMVVAALVVGLAFGYGVVLVREVRRPTVGDAAEVERLTAAPVLRHTRETATAPDRRTTRRERPGVPRIIDQESDTFVVLHLALTGVGDVVTDVDVLAADPVIAAAVALGTAAAASRESRAVMVIEETRRTPLLARLLRGGRRSAAAQRAAPVVASKEVITLARDTRIDVQFGDQDLSSDSSHDLRLHLPDATAEQGDAARRSRDLIVCVRQGSTPLAWLSRTMQLARRHQQRVRAVVLWSRDVPAGS